MAAPTAPQGEGAPPEAGGAGGPQHHSSSAGCFGARWCWHHRHRGRPFTLEPTDGTFTLRHLYPGTAAVAPRPLASRAREQIGDHPAYRGSWGAGTPPKGPTWPLPAKYFPARALPGLQLGQLRLRSGEQALVKALGALGYGQGDSARAAQRRDGRPQAPGHPTGTHKGDRAPQPCPHRYHSTETPGRCREQSPQGIYPTTVHPSPLPFMPRRGQNPATAPSTRKGTRKGTLGDNSPIPNTTLRRQGGGHGGTSNPGRAERPFPPSPGVGVPTVCLGVPPPAQGTRDTGQEGTGPGGNSGTRGVI